MTVNLLPRRTAIVTGASRGIGAAIAVALAKRGIAPILAVRDVSSASATQQAVEALNIPCRVERCDVNDADDVLSLIENTLRAWGRIDALVNNAGSIGPIGHIADTDADAWAQAVHTNLVGPYTLTRAALPELQKRNGTVISLSSGAALRAREGWSAYCSSKAALAMLMRSIAHEYGERGVSAYSVQPGVVDTDMQGLIRESGMNEISRIPRDSLSPPHISAGVIAWLADERPQNLAGQEVIVNEDLVQCASRTHENRITNR